MKNRSMSWRVKRIAQQLRELSRYRSRRWDSLLDVGGDDGKIALELANIHHIGTVYVAEVQSVNTPGVIFVDSSNGTFDNIQSNSIDVVLARLSLHHMSSLILENILSEIDRVLKYGGNFIIEEHDATNADVVAAVEIRHIPYNMKEPGRYFSRTELLDTMKNRGYKLSHEIRDPTDWQRRYVVMFEKIFDGESHNTRIPQETVAKWNTGMRNLGEWINTPGAREYTALINKFYRKKRNVSSRDRGRSRGTLSSQGRGRSRGTLSSQGRGRSRGTLSSQGRGRSRGTSSSQGRGRPKVISTKCVIPKSTGVRRAQDPGQLRR
jgi:SAM-dependent methyltransferase